MELRSTALAPALAASDRCEIAKANFSDAERDLELYRRLVFAMACLFCAFLVAGIILVALGHKTRGAGIVSFVGTAASGIGMRVVFKQRNEARDEKDAAAELVGKYCGADGQTASTAATA